MWIFDDLEEEEHITSFSSICLVMDLDCERVRAQVLKLQTCNLTTGLSYGSWTA